MIGNGRYNYIKFLSGDNQSIVNLMFPVPLSEVIFFPGEVESSNYCNDKNE